MKTLMSKDGQTHWVKPRFVQNNLDRGWSIVDDAKSKKSKAVIKATAEVTEDWDPNQEEWADSAESVIQKPISNEGED
jgi:hypothetical protein